MASKKGYGADTKGGRAWITDNWIRKRKKYNGRKGEGDPPLGTGPFLPKGRSVEKRTQATGKNEQSLVRGRNNKQPAQGGTENTVRETVGL